MNERIHYVQVSNLVLMGHYLGSILPLLLFWDWEQNTLVLFEEDRR